MVEARAVCASETVPPGAIVAAAVGDDDVVVWRDAAGGVHVLEARCPHLWNHLAAVGEVHGRELVCTAHFWRFDTAGRGTLRLSDGSRQAMRDLRCYDSWEADGWVWVAPG